MYNFSKLQSEAACKNSVSRTQVDNSTTMKTLTKKSNDRNLPTNLKQNRCSLRISCQANDENLRCMCTNSSACSYDDIWNGSSLSMHIKKSLNPSTRTSHNLFLNHDYDCI